MKNKFIKTLLLSLLIVGCGNNSSTSNTDSSSNNSTSSTSSSVSTSSTSSSVFTDYVELDIAYLNTKDEYFLKYDTDYDMYVEIYSSEMYYMMYASQNYIVLDSDPEYAHAFGTTRDVEDVSKIEMEVFGRAMPKQDIERFKERYIMSLLDFYVPKFSQVDINKWQYQSSSLCKEFSNYFQLKGLSYCSVIELTVGKDNRLDAIRFYELGAGELILSFGCRFEQFNLNNLEMYKKWKDKGSIVNERIIDYKMVKEANNTLVSLYEGEQVEFEATVVSKDTDGNLYVANKMSNNENTGIKLVNPKNNNFNICDVVTVKGDIKTTDFVVEIYNAEVKDTGKDSEFPPIFDEEVVENYYGGGTYAAQVFCTVPYYSGSVYSTYGYVSNIPNELNANGDTIVEVIFPTYVSENIAYHMEIIIPSNMEENKKIAMFESLQAAGIYGEEGCYELSLSNFVMEFDYTYFYFVRLLATDSSVVSKKLSAQEKIAEYAGLPSFPLPNVEEKPYSYRFGGITDQFLEYNYGIDGNDTEGVFVSYQEITLDQYDAFIDAVEMYGAELYDIIRDIYEGPHAIYTYNDKIIDIQLAISNTDDVYVLNIWIYSGEMLRTPNLKEKLNSEIGSWFDVDNFLLFNNTYDKDYTIFKLYDYANISFTAESPLYCVTLDTQEPILMDYCYQLVFTLGYKQLRDSYISRGQSHYLFEKDGVILDVAAYPTTDYTYSGHDEFQYRLEILIYKSDRPIEVPKYDNLDALLEKIEYSDPGFKYSIDLPDDVEIEVWSDLRDYRLSPVTYGYGGRDEAFIYTEDVDGVYNSIMEGLIASGYKKSYEHDHSSGYSKTIGKDTQYIFVLKEPDKGYVRLMHSVGGVSFMR